MWMRVVSMAALGASLSLAQGCATSSQVNFPPSKQLFVTTGDGDIAKPYEPLGVLLYTEYGFRLSIIPILGLIPFHDVDPDVSLQRGISDRVRKMGGDGVINLNINWTPPSNGFLGLGAYGGHIAIYGTVIRR